MQRRGLPRLGARLRSGDEARIAAFGGSITYEGYYVAGLTRVIAQAYPKAVVRSLTLGLPGFASEVGVFRTRSAAELKADLTLVEFAVHDAGSPPEVTARAVEGIVRQLRAADPDREIAFVYFGHLQTIRDGAMRAVLETWEKIAEYYSIPSFDGIALAEALVKNGQAAWFARWQGTRVWDVPQPFPLTRDGGLHTASGGSVLGAQIAQAMLPMLDTHELKTSSEPPPPLDRLQWSDALAMRGVALRGEGWTGGPISDGMADRGAAIYFDELLAANDAGAKLRIPFTGRYATVWTIGAGGTVAAAIDGKWSILKARDDQLQHPFNLLNAEENRPHVLEIEARNVPAVVAGVDLLGKL